MVKHVSILGGLHKVFVKALESHQRLLIVRVDLRYSARFDLPFDVETNRPLRRFFDELEKQLDDNEAQRWNLGLGVNKHDMWHAWAREVGPESGIPQYHLVLILNGDAHRRVGNYSDPQAPELYRRLHLVWARAIDIPEDLAEGLLSMASNGQWFVNRRDQVEIRDVF